MRRALPILFIFLSVRAFSEPLAETQSRFGVITGDVGLLTQGAKDWIEPHEGLPIEPGDHIRTGDDGRVELIMSENALWLLEPQSDVVAEHMDANSGLLDVSSGTLIGKVDSGRTAGTVQRWEFSTPAAVAAVRGTEFGLVFSKATGARLAVFEGAIDFQPAETAEGLQPSVEVSLGHEAVARRGRSIQIGSVFSPSMKGLSATLPAFRRRLARVQNTWSPFTPDVRSEARKKFVAAPPKPVKRPRRILPKPRSSPTS